MRPSPNFISKRERLNIERIILRICESIVTTPEEILGKSRDKYVVFARHLTMYAIRKQMGLSYPSIASFFQMDHTSIVHAVHKSIGNMKILNEYNDIFNYGDKVGIAVDKPVNEVVVKDLSLHESTGNLQAVLPLHGEKPS